MTWVVEGEDLTELVFQLADHHVGRSGFGGEQGDVFLPQQACDKARETIRLFLNKLYAIVVNLDHGRGGFDGVIKATELIDQPQIQGAFA